MTGLNIGVTVLMIGIAGGLAASRAGAEESEASRAARWRDVSAALFPGRVIQDGSGIVTLDAPPRALDAALVPVTITASPAAKIAALTLVVDDNPAPVAASVHFGPAGDGHLFKTRVRVDQYTLLHAVVETADGKLLSVARFIKAAGGCSAPGSVASAEAAARIGRMKLLARDGGDASTKPGGRQAVELLISHPNANGMQMDQLTRNYTPARYVQSVKISQGGQPIMTVQGDISLSEDPAFTFLYAPRAESGVDVEVTDSTKAVFTRHFSGTGS